MPRRCCWKRKASAPCRGARSSFIVVIDDLAEEDRQEVSLLNLDEAIKAWLIKIPNKTATFTSS